MKNRKNLVILGSLVIVIAVALIGVSLKQKNQTSIVVPAEKVRQMISNGNLYYDPEDLQKSLTKNGNEIDLIDLRSPDQFLDNAITGAINIPFQRILEDEYRSYFTDNKLKVIYTDQESKAAEVWTLLTQMGYQNVYVLKGGLDYWKAKIEHQDIFGNASLDNEKARFDFKKELEGE